VLRQLHQQRDYLLSKGFDVTVVALANSKRFVADAKGINLASWEFALQSSADRMDRAVLTERIAGMELTNAALVDCTASPAVVDAYPDFVNGNLHIVTPNKRANVLPWPRYTALVELLERRQKHFLYEANVGAGLPVMSTLRDLIASGDRVDKVEGILSGTLSYLFNTFDGSVPFSELVREAHAKGLTEPDPRDDLSGEDVARKLLILGREIGWAIDIRDIEVESLASGPFTALDRTLGPRLTQARARGAVLRYVGTLEGGRGRAGIQEFARDHPVATTRGSDNIIAFTTKRYSHTPLVLQGPGAGADVTAMGVFSDLLKLLHYLPE
jgi:bifunctional aspartokinase / homoserine dehydrogenase 1